MKTPKKKPSRWQSRIHTKRMRWWQLSCIDSIVADLEAALGDCMPPAATTRRKGRRQLPFLSLRKRPLLPETLAQPGVGDDELLCRWLATRVAEDAGLHTRLSPIFLDRLLAHGVARHLDDYEKPGRWSVALLALALEGEPVAVPVWHSVIRTLADPRPADAMFLALLLAPSDLRELRRFLGEDRKASAAAEPVMRLAEDLSDLASGTLSRSFAGGPLTKRWLDQLANRGFRRGHARAAGRTAASVTPLASWPAWLRWEGEPTPPALTWMAVEWLLSLIRALPRKRRSELFDAELLATDSGSVTRHSPQLPAALTNLCETTEDGDEIAAWALEELQTLMGITAHTSHVAVSPLGGGSIGSTQRRRKGTAS